jgi:hypothetical protein
MDSEIKFVSNCKCTTKYDTNFDAPDVHFDYLSLFSGTHAKKVGNLMINLMIQSVSGEGILLSG